MSIIIPDGKAAIMAAYHVKHITTDGVITDPKDWENTYIANAMFPHPIPTYDNSMATHARVYKSLVPALEKVMQDIYTNHPASYHQLFYSGAFNPRKKRTAGEFSLHSLGVAIDLNDSMFPLVSGHTFYESDMPEWFRYVIDAFHSDGWKWGGDFGDRMHFQAAKGY